MKVTSTGIVDGKIQDRFGKRGDQFNEYGICTYSLPLKIEDAPEGTVSFAVACIDFDAVPPAGFPWIHWLAANITRSELKENECISATDFVQGTTTWSSHHFGKDRMVVSMYGGPAPNDAPHVYDFQVYALDTMLNLEKGFYLNELYKAMDGHILAQYTLKGIYDNAPKKA